jgi:hypothetical protein
MFSKDLERVARSMHGQRLERDYIRHYLIETYQLDPKAVDDLLEKVGVPKPVGRGQTPGKGPAKDGPIKKGFY